MSLAKIDLDKTLNLEFELQIEGVKESVSEIRFVIEGEEKKISFNGSYTNGMYSVKIPPLGSMVEAGERACYLEVIADGRYFKPMEESIEFLAPVKVVSQKGKQKQIEEEIKTTAKPVSIVQEGGSEKDSAPKQKETAVKVSAVNTSHVFENKALASGYFLENSPKYVFSKDKQGNYTGAKNKQTDKFAFFESQAKNLASATLMAIREISK